MSLPNTEQELFNVLDAIQAQPNISQLDKTRRKQTIVDDFKKRSIAVGEQAAEEPDRITGAAKGAVGLVKAGLEKGRSGSVDIIQAFKPETVVETITPEGEEAEERVDIGDRALANRARQFFRGVGRLSTGALEGIVGVTPVGVGVGATLGALEPEVQEGVQAILETDAGRKAFEEFSKLEPGQREAVGNIAEGLLTGIGARAIGADVGATQQAARRGAAAVSKKLFPVQNIDDIVGKVVQGTKADIPAAKKALSKIDLKGIKTFEEVGSALDNKVKELSSKVDDFLGKDAMPRKLSTLQKVEEVTTTTGKVKKVKTNFVQKSIDQLEELYTKTDDAVNAARIKDLKQVAKKTGLTARQLNDLAREYGVEFGNKAFSKRTGDPLTSVNAQSFENVRKGVKSTVRDLFTEDAPRVLDGEISSLLKTKKLVNKLEENVNKLSQKVNKRGILEGVSRGLGRAVDVITLGSIRGFLTSFLPSNIGNKVLNSLDLESQLAKSLKTIQKALKAQSDDQVTKAVVDLAKENDITSFLENISAFTAETGVAEQPSQ